MMMLPMVKGHPIYQFLRYNAVATVAIMVCHQVVKQAIAVAVEVNSSRVKVQILKNSFGTAMSPGSHQYLLLGISWKDSKRSLLFAIYFTNTDCFSIMRYVCPPSVIT